jgi:hypothetical protein
LLRRQNSQNLADSTATSSLHPACITLRFLGYWVPIKLGLALPWFKLPAGSLPG